jgi:hypothetical protein
MRPGSYAGMPEGSSACVPIGPGVPAGGWKEAAPGRGPGYPPTGGELLRAIGSDLPFSEQQAARLGQFGDDYSSWISSMARR